MADLNQARIAPKTSLKEISLPLAASQSVFQGGMACGDTADGLVRKGAAGSTTLLRIGKFAQNLDNSAGTTSVQVMVSLDKEIWGEWFDNVTGANRVLAANLFDDVYMLDDHTVTLDSTGNSKAGRVWAVDSVRGVLVEAYWL